MKSRGCFHAETPKGLLHLLNAGDNPTLGGRVNQKPGATNSPGPSARANTGEVESCVRVMVVHELRAELRRARENVVGAARSENEGEHRHGRPLRSRVNLMTSI